MRKNILMIIVGLSFGIIGSVANAQEEIASVPKGPALDKIIFQVSAERWVSTSQANVVINIDASLDKENLSNLRKKIEENLQSIAKADWRITQFNRSQDSSGLEKLNIQAEARVSESVLTNINQQTKDLSKPGVTFKVERIDFFPSLAEMEKTRNEVRTLIYQQINDEVAALQKAYPKQAYTVNVVDFIGGITPAAMAKQEGGSTGGAMMLASPAAMSVSNKVEMTATVILAATRADDASKSKRAD